MAEGFTIQAELKGITEFSGLLNRLSDAVRGEVVQNALLAGAYIIEGYAKVNAVYDTGFMRNSIYAKNRRTSNYAKRVAEARAVNKDGPIMGESDTPSEQSAIVAVAAEYGAYVEYGTSRMGAQPYMRPAVDQHIPEITEAIAANLSDSIAKALV